MLDQGKIFVLEGRDSNWNIWCWFFNDDACRFWLRYLHLFNRFWVRRNFRVTDWQSARKQFQNFKCFHSFNRLSLRRFILDIADMCIIFWYFLMLLLIFLPGLNPLCYLFNPLRGSILMMTRIYNFCASFIFDDKIIILFLDGPRSIFFVKHFHRDNLLETNMFFFLVQI